MSNSRTLNQVLDRMISFIIYLTSERSYSNLHTFIHTATFQIVICVLRHWGCGLEISRTFTTMKSTPTRNPSAPVVFMTQKMSQFMQEGTSEQGLYPRIVCILLDKHMPDLIALKL